MSTPVKSMEGIVIGISEIKYKDYTFGNKHVTYEMRYINVEVPGEGRILVRMQDRDFTALPVNKEGVSTPLHNGDIVNFENFQKEFLFRDTGGIMRTNPAIVTIIGHVQETQVQKYPLSGISFYDWGVTLENSNSKCSVKKADWDTMTGLETSIHLWKLKQKLKADDTKDCYVEVQALFNVHYGWDINRPWYNHNNGGQVLIISENLLALKKVKADEEEVMRTRLLLDEIKQLLQNKMFVTFDDLTTLARKYTIPEKEIEEYVRNAVWKREYDETFTNWLKEKASKILYGTDGLFYCLPNGITVLEDPEPNRASYIFIASPDYIASQIEAMKRENSTQTTAWRELMYRLKKSKPQSFLWFWGRVYHIDTDQWTRDMEAVLREATSKAPTILKSIPTDPTKYNTSAVAYINKEEKAGVEARIPSNSTPVSSPPEIREVTEYYCEKCKVWHKQEEDTYKSHPYRDHLPYGEGTKIQVKLKPKYALEQHLCKCGSTVWAHVDITDPKKHKPLKVYITELELVEQDPEYIYCPSCGGSEENGKLHFNKVYSANKNGEVTE